MLSNCRHRPIGRHLKDYAGTSSVRYGPHPHAQLNGHFGQTQHGFDILGTNATTGSLEGFQCKGIDGVTGGKLICADCWFEIENE
jgi:hypothetical protein